MARLSLRKVPEGLLLGHEHHPYDELSFSRNRPKVGERVMYTDGSTSDFDGAFGTVVAAENGTRWMDESRGEYLQPQLGRAIVVFDDLDRREDAWSCRVNTLTRVMRRADTVSLLLRYGELETIEQLIGGGLVLHIIEYESVRRELEAHYAELGEPVPYSVELMLTCLHKLAKDYTSAHRKDLAIERLEARMVEWAKREHRRRDSIQESNPIRLKTRLNGLGAAVSRLVKHPHDVAAAVCVIGSHYYEEFRDTIPRDKIALALAIERSLDRLSGAAADGTRWKKVEWHGERWFNPVSEVYSPDGALTYHMTHVSVKDPTLIAYHQSVDKAIRDVQTPMKPGAYLKKFFGDVLSDAEIKMWAERHVLRNTPPKVHFVENDNPDGWELGYEKGKNFQSCMTYDRDGRYIHSQLCGEDHPVRAYANPGNGLRLAWLGLPDKDGNPAEVHARAIVFEPVKLAIRVYGDGRLGEALTQLGYSIGGGIGGVKLVKRSVPWDERGGFIVPYIDGDAQYITVMDDHILVGSSGPSSGSSSGWITEGGRGGNNDNEDEDDNTGVCDCCGERYDYDDLYTSYDGDGGHMVCHGCVDHGRTWTWGISRYGNPTPISVDDAVTNESNGETYDVNHLDRHNIEWSDYANAYFFLDDLVETLRGLVPESDAVALDRDDADGNTYAVRGDTVTLDNGLVVHEDDAQQDVASNEEVYKSEALTFWGPHARYQREYSRRTHQFELIPYNADVVTADSLEEHLDDFFVLGDWLVYHYGDAPYGAIPLRDWLLVSSNYETLANTMDAEDGGDEWLMVLDEIRDTLLAEMCANAEEVEEDDVVLLDIPQQQQAA